MTKINTALIMKIADLPVHQQVNVAHIGFVRCQLPASIFQDLFREKVPDAPPEMLSRDFTTLGTFQDLRHLHIEFSEVVTDIIVCRSPS